MEKVDTLAVRIAEVGDLELTADEREQVLMEMVDVVRAHMSRQRGQDMAKVAYDVVRDALNLKYAYLRRGVSLELMDEVVQALETAYNCRVYGRPLFNPESPRAWQAEQRLESFNRRCGSYTGAPLSLEACVLSDRDLSELIGL